MYTHKISFGDLVYIVSNTCLLLASHNSPGPIFTPQEPVLPTSFRNGLFQILSVAEAQERPAIREPSSTYDPENQTTPRDREGFVKQGTPVILYHLETDSFLSISEDYKGSATPMSATLTQAVSFDNVMTLSHLKGYDDILYYDQPLYIQLQGVNLFLKNGESREKKVLKTRGKSDKRLLVPDIVPRKSVFDDIRVFSNAEFHEIGSTFNLINYQTAQFLKEHRQTVSNGDYIRLRYIDKWMTVYQSLEEQKDVYFERVNKKPQNHSSLNTIFQVIDINSFKGDSIVSNTTKKYILKHYMTGAYIHFNSPNDMKAYDEFSDFVNETTYCYFEAKGDKETIIIDEMPLRIKNAANQDYTAYIKPTDVQFLASELHGMTTLLFFGFINIDEYHYKNERNLERFVAGTSNVFDDEEQYNIVFEKISSKEFKRIVQVERLASSINESRDQKVFSDVFSEQDIRDCNNNISNTNVLCQNILKGLNYGRINPEIEQIERDRLIESDYSTYTLLRELRIFDQIPRMLYQYTFTPLASDKTYVLHSIDQAKLLELFKLYGKIIRRACIEDSTNVFYNCQFIKIYINLMFEPSFEAFKDTVALRQQTKRVTLKILKALLRNGNLNSIGQLIKFKDRLFSFMDIDRSYDTYYLELLEFYSNPKRCEFTSLYRDSFLSEYLRREHSQLRIFPLILLDQKELFVELKNQVSPLSQLHEKPTEYKYFIAAIRATIALSSSKQMLLYHQAFMTFYPLNVLQAILEDSQVYIEIKLLMYLVVLHVHVNYVQSPLMNLPTDIIISPAIAPQISNTTKSMLNNLSQFLVGDLEKHRLIDKGILDEFEQNIPLLSSNTLKGYKINLLRTFYSSHSNSSDTIKIIIFYIGSIISNGDFDVSFLQVAFEVLLDLMIVQQAKKTKKMFKLLSTLVLVHSKLEESIHFEIASKTQSSFDAENEKQILDLHAILKDLSVMDTVDLNDYRISIQTQKYVENIKSVRNTTTNSSPDYLLLTSKEDMETFTTLLDFIGLLTCINRDCGVYQEITRTPLISTAQFQQTRNTIGNLLCLIYNPNIHYPQFMADDPTPPDFHAMLVDFIQQGLEHVFRIKPSAIVPQVQDLFQRLSLHEILLDLLTYSLNLALADQPPQTYFPRTQLTKLLIVLLTIFVYNNKANQKALTSHGAFLKLYYNRDFLNKSLYVRTLFSESIRDNQEILSLDQSRIHAILHHNTINHISLCAFLSQDSAFFPGIVLLPSLLTINIHKEVLDVFRIIRIAFEKIFAQDKGVLYQINQRPEGMIYVSFPPLFYNFIETLRSIFEVLRRTKKEGKSVRIVNLQGRLNSHSTLLGLMTFEEAAPFRVKALVLQCINKLHLSKTIFNEEFLSTQNMLPSFRLVVYLLSELGEFLAIYPRNPNPAAVQKAWVELDEVCQDNVRLFQDEEENLSFEFLKEKQSENRKELYYFSESFENCRHWTILVWKSTYIYDVAWKFVVKLCRLYPAIIIKSGLFGVIFEMSQQLIALIDKTDSKALDSIQKHYEAINCIQEYQVFKEDIHKILELIASKKKLLNTIPTLD